MKKIISKGKVIFGVFLFSLIPIAIIIFKDTEIISLSYMRVLITTLFILIVWNKTKIKFNKIKDIRYILFGIFHGSTILTSFYAIKNMSVTLATLLLFFGNIYLFIILKWFQNEKFILKEVGILLISVIGMSLVFFEGNITNNIKIFALIMAIASGVFYALSFVYAKILSKKDSGINLTFIQNLIATGVLLPFILKKGISFSLNDITAYIIIGIVLTAVPFLLIYSEMKYLKSNEIANLLILNIPLPIIFAAIFLGEKIELLPGIGAGMIILSSIYTLKDNRNKIFNKKIN